ncbi:MAG TPA: Crp/Fnr family transcriptional regulator [Chitinophaga sp.]|uniref:Crp/Fnr family transcriptional regulator n=1 Tax=Chitinophaga sp. TaxID=1869181 RepID=UPI002CE9D695|nr:Crp/Fnr family transcriptional regulator [Chitinophaga sp.]HVI46432.1 Crp/Fnr family transcriptional regulator [Chitinophaga sp.]
MVSDTTPYYQSLTKKYPFLTTSDWQQLEQIATIKKIRKGDSFLRYGKVARYTAFVLEGVFKFSIQDEEGNEKIVKFSFADDFLANCESHAKNAPSAVSITAVEDAVIARIPCRQLNPLYNKYPNLLHLNVELCRELLEQQSEHQYILALKSPLQRYKYLLERRPTIIRRISLTNIARYLYTSREALSRARLCLIDQARNLYD